MQKVNSRHNECNMQKRIRVPEGKLCSPNIHCTNCKHGIKWNNNGTIFCEIYNKDMPPMSASSCYSWEDKWGEA